MCVSALRQRIGEIDPRTRKCDDVNPTSLESSFATSTTTTPNTKVNFQFSRQNRRESLGLGDKKLIICKDFNTLDVYSFNEKRRNFVCECACVECMRVWERERESYRFIFVCEWVRGGRKERVRCLYLCVCVCVREGERERERESIWNQQFKISNKILHHKQKTA